MTYKEYNEIFDRFLESINEKKALPTYNDVGRVTWRQYADILKDALHEAKIPYQYVGATKARLLDGKPVWMGSDIDNLPLETQIVVNEFTDHCGYSAIFKAVHADQCKYLIFAR